MHTLRQMRPCRMAGGILTAIRHAPPPPAARPMTPHDPYTALKNMALLPLFEVPSCPCRVEALLTEASEDSAEPLRCSQPVHSRGMRLLWPPLQGVALITAS